jgi:hypothetical protein
MGSRIYRELSSNAALRFPFSAPGIPIYSLPVYTCFLIRRYFPRQAKQRDEMIGDMQYMLTRQYHSVCTRSLALGRFETGNVSMIILSDSLGQSGNEVRSPTITRRLTVIQRGLTIGDRSPLHSAD